ncbi:hypothetical protein ARMSODRAFT_513999 [Armillaria solidipes]|uniref:Uncharacterized protein n=1 Tax=Armillaria solidipes TaxID=1076256 RepID=A0A2H3CIY7_9AGAR|nr:hypothetical protein ARMSODRAFT_513999 [Armillaria solidipes]
MVRLTTWLLFICQSLPTRNQHSFIFVNKLAFLLLHIQHLRVWHLWSTISMTCRLQCRESISSTSKLSWPTLSHSKNYSLKESGQGLNVEDTFAGKRIIPKTCMCSAKWRMWTRAAVAEFD